MIASVPKLKRPGIFFKDPVAHGTYNYEGNRPHGHILLTKQDQSETELPIELLSDCITYKLIEENQSVPTL